MDKKLTLELDPDEATLLQNILTSNGFNVPAPLVRTVARLQDKMDKLLATEMKDG